MPHTVIALYRPKSGQAEALLKLVHTHVPQLRALGLATATPATLLRSKHDGTLLEIFDWQSDAAVESAHSSPEVQALWTLFSDLCEFTTLSSLEESKLPFPHFERLQVP
jgi:quinol monooxygenase YgiN